MKPQKLADSERVCMSCLTPVHSKYDDFCSGECWDAFHHAEYEWYFDVDNGYRLGKPLARPLYRATVSSYFGDIETFHRYEHAAAYVHNMFKGNVSQGDIVRSIRINLIKD